MGDRGRTPKWCSQSCRQRAWEQRRAAASGLAAVEVVVRTVEVDKPVKVKVTERVEVPVMPSRRTWPSVLAELANQIDRGLLYDRDLTELASAVTNVLRAPHRRPPSNDSCAAPAGSDSACGSSGALRERPQVAWLATTLRHLSREGVRRRPAAVAAG